MELAKKMTKKEIKEFESSACEWRDHWVDEEIMDLEIIVRKLGAISKANGDLELSLSKANTLYQDDSEETITTKLKILKRIKNQREKDGGW